MTASASDEAPVFGRPALRDPDTWLSAAAWLVVALSVFQILLFPFGRDQSIYAVVGEAVLRGEMPYRDAWDFKPPGIFLVYALAQGVFGKAMFAPRILEAAGIVGIVFGFRRLARTHLDRPAAGVVGGAVAALTHAELEYWHSGQPESFGAFFTVGALVLLLTPSEGRRKIVHLAIVGAMLGCAFLLKPPLGGIGIVCAAYAARGEIHRTGLTIRALGPVAALALGAMAIIGGCLAWFWAKGAWESLRWTMLEFAPGYTKLSWGNQSPFSTYYYGVEEAFFRLSSLIGAGFLVAVLLPPLHGRERELVLLILGFVAVQIAGIAMQAKFFQYHYGSTLPLLALVAGIGIYKGWLRARAAGPPAIALLGALVTLVAVMRIPVRDLRDGFWSRSAERMLTLFSPGSPGDRREREERLYSVADFSLAEDREAAEAVMQLTSPSDRVLVWGFEPAIYWLADRLPASRYVYDVPQRTEWGRERARRELMDDLRGSVPAALVVQSQDTFSWVTGDEHDSLETLASFPELAQLIVRDYEWVERRKDFDIYRRRPVNLVSVP